MSLSRYASTGEVERLTTIERSASSKSRRSIRSMRSLSDSNSSLATSQTKHKRNDYSCYIHVINKTGTNLQLVNSKAVSGKWAPGSPPHEIESDAHTLIELTDPKGPHGSEGWCSFRLHHPNKSNAITFTLKFGDPYWARDDNFLNAYTSYPEWIKLNLLGYQTNGHPFIAYVEVDFAEGKAISGRKRQEIVDEAMSQSSRSSEDEKLPKYEFNANNPYELGKEPIPTIHVVDADSDADYLTHAKKDSAIALVYPDEGEGKIDHYGDDDGLVEEDDFDGHAQTQEIIEEWPERMVEEYPMEMIEEEPIEQASDLPKNSQDVEAAPLESAEQPTTQVSEETIEDRLETDAGKPSIKPTLKIEDETPTAQTDNEVHEPPQEPVNEPFPQIAEQTTPITQDEKSVESDEAEWQPAAEAETPQDKTREIVIDPIKEVEAVETPSTSTSVPTRKATGETSEQSVPEYSITTSEEEDELKEDEYIRVNESKFETLQPRSPRSLPIVARSPESNWSVFTSQKARLGIVAMVFLATWGFTATRVSGGLMGRIGRR